MLRNPIRTCRMRLESPAVDSGLFRTAVCILIILPPLCFVVLALFFGDGYINENQTIAEKFTPNRTQRSHRAPFIEQKICATKECNETASRILRNMNSLVDPCDDFYEFACGGFVASTDIPADQTKVDAFTEIRRIYLEQLRSSVEEPSHATELKPFHLVKRFYQSCMDTKEIEKQESEPLKKMLKQLGGWPILEGDSWNETTFDWMNSAYKFRESGYSFNQFIDLDVIEDPKNSSKSVIRIGPPITGINVEEDIEFYLKYMTKVAVILGVDEKRAEQELESTLFFMVELEIIPPPITGPDDRYIQIPTTIHELSQKHDWIPWKEHINRLLPQIAPISNDEQIIVKVPSFIAHLKSRLELYPIRDQANYAMWRVVSESMKYLNEELRKSQLNISSVVSGRTELEPRWEECTDIVAKFLPVGAGAMYVRKHFHKDTKNYISDMATAIRNAYMKIVNKARWIDETTKKSVLDKVSSIKTLIAYSDEFFDDKKIEKVYENLDLKTEDFLGMFLNLNMFKINKTFEKVRDSAKMSELLLEPVIANAVYYYNKNSILLPANMMLGVIFHEDRPRYINYGAIGTFIGHEMAHSFDSFDLQLKDVKNGKPWPCETTKKYMKKIKCMTHQYGNYTSVEVEMKVNGVSTLRENMADNSGIKEAYYAYLEWARHSEPEPRLPGLPYNPKQMFWISNANTRCSKYRPEVLKFLIINGNHSPNKFRVLGPLSNSPEFSSDFHCPLKSEMNREKKCSIW